MKLLKFEDCEDTSPPSTVFLALVESESDRAFLGEIHDLSTAARALTDEHLPEDKRGEICIRGKTNRVTLVPWSIFIQTMPNATQDFIDEIEHEAMTEWKLSPDFKLQGQAFVMRCFHY